MGTLLKRHRWIAPVALLAPGLLWLLPKPPMSPDNLRSMDVDTLTDGAHDYPGWQPAALESLAPTYLSPAEIEANFDLAYHTKHVDTIFARVFGK